MKTQNETAKVFIEMGSRVGIRNPRRTHRGIIAKRYLEKIDKYELAKFEESMQKIEFKTPVPVKVMGEVAYYL